MIVAELFATLGIARDAKSWDEGHHSLEGLKHAVEAIGAIEIGKSIGEHLVELFKGAAEQVETSERLAQSLGMTSAAVQELGYAAKVSLVPAEALQVAMQHVALGMADARKTGTGPLVDALGTLGVSFASIRDKSPDELLAILADRFAKMPDGMRKSGAAMQAFGRSGAELIPLLDKGAAGIAELRREAVTTGNAIEGEGAESLRRYNEAAISIGASFHGLGNTLAVALAPAVADLAEKFQTWLGAHHEQLIAGITTAAHDLSSALVDGAQVVGFLVDHMETFEAIAVAAGTAMLGFGVQSAIAWAMALGPIDLIIVGVAAVIAATVEIVKHWDAVKASIGKAWDALKDAGTAAFDWLADLPVIKQLLELMQWLADKAGFSTEHERALEGSANESRAYQKAHPEDPELKNLPRNGTKAQQDAFDRDVHPLDWTPPAGDPANTYSAPVSSSYSTTIAAGAVQIQIDAGNADSSQTAQIAGGVFDQRIGKLLRDAHAGTGGRDR